MAWHSNKWNPLTRIFSPRPRTWTLTPVTIDRIYPCHPSFEGEEVLCDQSINLPNTCIKHTNYEQKSQEGKRKRKREMLTKHLVGELPTFPSHAQWRWNSLTKSCTFDAFKLLPCTPCNSNWPSLYIKNNKPVPEKHRKKKVTTTNSKKYSTSSLFISKKSKTGRERVHKLWRKKEKKRQLLFPTVPSVIQVLTTLKIGISYWKRKKKTEMGRIPCCEKDNVKRGQWTPEEDNKLSSYIAQHGTRNWRLIPKNAG